MPKKQVIYVPGKNPKPEPEQHRALLWRTLVEGVRRADSAAADTLQEAYESFHLISWNHAYYHEYKDITIDVPWIDALINKHGPTDQDVLDAHSWNIRLDRSMLTLADHLPFLVRFLPEAVRSTAHEIDRYFNNTDDVARKIRDMLKRSLKAMFEQHDDVLLIGHSLGSVICYDTLWELTQEGIKNKIDFLTVGSPLGLHYFQHRLLGMKPDGEITYPGLIRRWVNISAEGDVAALNQDCSKSFYPMLELGLVQSIEDHCHGIYNFFRSDEGLNSHRSYGYLVNPAVGGIIADWWQH